MLFYRIFMGITLQSHGKTQFMILHSQRNEWIEEFISLDYNVEQVICDLYTSGLNDAAPYWCRVTELYLQTGEFSHGSVLAKAFTYYSYT